MYATPTDGTGTQGTGTHRQRTGAHRATTGTGTGSHTPLTAQTHQPTLRDSDSTGRRQAHPRRGSLDAGRQSSPEPQRCPHAQAPARHHARVAHRPTHAAHPTQPSTPPPAECAAAGGAQAPAPQRHQGCAAWTQFCFFLRVGCLPTTTSHSSQERQCLRPSLRHDMTLLEEFSD